MIYFECDYQEGCAPEILERMQATNTEQTAGYGLDPHCEHARKLIMQACGLEDKGTERTWRGEQTAGTVHFLVGGTQTNTLVINSLLRPHQGVLCADSGHVNVHETGAIEHSGHKVLALPTKDGKLTAVQVQDAILAHLYDPNIEHVVQPGMVYLSFPTETGQLYSKAELQAISAICRQYGLPLYIDGARMGYGLASPEADVSLQDIAQAADIFYIGGTKQGALFGEALVIANPAIRKDFRYLIKQSGGMLAKGRLLGIQFETLFTDGLYMRLARHAVEEALRIRQALEDKGYALPWKNATNQQFAVIDNGKLEEIGKEFVLSEVSRPDEGHTLVRICTSWATKKEHTDMLIAAL
jgi:threonine aldolase